MNIHYMLEIGTIVKMINPAKFSQCSIHYGYDMNAKTIYTGTVGVVIDIRKNRYEAEYYVLFEEHGVVNIGDRGYAEYYLGVL